MSLIPVTILHGFLGSGKTTFLRNILQQTEYSGDELSVIVNDMSELDIDGVLILNTDAVSEDQGNFVTISGDSISSPSGVQKLDKALKKGSSRLSGEGRFYLHKKVIRISVPIAHSFD
ncbi:GTP-binding protein [Vibrio lentus]|uniref:GTP-binding protein n=1 Tax=Vibrio lentus TaxID=136468 RepID=UPI0038A43E07